MVLKVLSVARPRNSSIGEPLAPAILAVMANGTELILTFQDLKQQKVTVSVPLNAVGKAYKKL